MVLVMSFLLQREANNISLTAPKWSEQLEKETWTGLAFRFSSSLQLLLSLLSPITDKVDTNFTYYK
jgi:hypothetical protein